MRFYMEQHRYYCGIDLHARSMYVCVLDQKGQTAVHRKLPTEPAPLLRLLKPYRRDVAVAVECLFCWYWLADLCAAEGIPFVLGHALYMKAIHGGKSKNDKIDSYKIAALLRGGNLPLAYVYPREMRATRDVLRRRLFFVRHRAGLLAHIQMTITQYNLPPFEKRIDQARNRDGLLEQACIRRGPDAPRYARRTLQRALERTGRATARRVRPPEIPRSNPEEVRLPRI